MLKTQNKLVKIIDHDRDRILVLEQRLEELKSEKASPVRKNLSQEDMQLQL